MQHLERNLHSLYDAVELINSTFTFHLIFIMINIIIFQTFICYGILWELLLHSEILIFVLMQHGAWLATHFLLEIMIAYFGSILTRNAREPAIIITKIITNVDLSVNMSTALQNVIVRLNSRETIIQNEFFKIDWQLLVYVSRF